MEGGLAQVGESWSGYLVLEALGHNGISERYRVRGEDGATRLLDVLAVRHPDLLARLKEAELERVAHPNLLPVKAVVSVLRFPAVVCADSLGEPLARWLKADPTYDERMRVFRGVVAAVGALHQAGLSHGFLNPGVVLVERARSGPVPKLGLPGVAAVVYRIMREGAAVSTSGAAFANDFQSPEQRRFPDRSDPQSDVFGLGCLLYWLLSGRSPFQGMDTMMAYECARNETWAPVQEVVDGVPPEAARLVQDLLRAEPTARPSAAETLERVDHVAPPPPVRWPYLVAAGMLLAAMAVGVGVVAILLAS